MLVARRCERTGAIVSETWGSEPWVAGELGGTTGVLEIVFRGHAARHQRGAHAGLGDFEPVTERSARAASSLAEMREANPTPPRSAARGGVRVERGVRGERAGTFGVATVGDRLKLMAAARAFAEGLGAEEEEE